MLLPCKTAAMLETNASEIAKWQQVCLAAKAWHQYKIFVSLVFKTGLVLDELWLTHDYDQILLLAETALSDVKYVCEVLAYCLTANLINPSKGIPQNQPELVLHSEHFSQYSVKCQSVNNEIFKQWIWIWSVNKVINFDFNKTSLQ